jgi:hypothetical protein
MAAGRKVRSTGSRSTSRKALDPSLQEWVRREVASLKKRDESQVARSRHPSIGFFDRTSTKAVITQLGDVEKLTIFIGAGASLDRGAPSWAGLMESLLAGSLIERSVHGSLRARTQSQLSEIYGRDAAGVMHLAGAPSDGLRDTARRYVEDVGVIQVASSLVEAFGGNRKLIKERIRAALYSDTSLSGPLTEAIVLLATRAKDSGRQVSIVTTNYDTLLELSSDGKCVTNEEGLSVSAFLRSDPHTIPVFHVHGFIAHPNERTVDREKESFVASETDFYRLGSQQQHLLKEVLDTTNCLFVGTSLTDPTFVRILTENSGPRRYAVLPRQGDKWRASTADDEQVPNRVAQEDAWFVDRMAHLGVLPIRTDFFSQVPVLLNEMSVALRPPKKAAAPPYIDYSTRLKSWWTSWEEVTERHGLRGRIVMSQLLRTCHDAVVEELRSKTGSDAGNFKLELWVRQNPSSREMVLWASSTALWLADNSTFHRSAIDFNSRYVAVQAFCDGGITRRKAQADRQGRWRTFLTTPVTLQSDACHGLPAGVISLLCDEPAETSAIYRLSMKECGEIGAGMEATGVVLLDPAEFDRAIEASPNLQLRGGPNQAPGAPATSGA